MNAGEIWFAAFPLEERPDNFILRPVIVMEIDRADVLSIKVTKHPPRPDDGFDKQIIYWREAGLNYLSTARISKIIYLDKSQFHFRIGTLHPFDLTKIQNLFIVYISQINTYAKLSLP